MRSGRGTYVGPVAPVWPLHRPAARVGCSALIWALLVVGLGLVVFSMGVGERLQAFMDAHTPAMWVAIGVASLVWPGLYVRAGWFRTLLGYWPRDDAEGPGIPCETCGSQVRKGRTIEGYYICDVCARERVRDSRRLIAPGVVMVGLAFVANGVGSLLQHRSRELAEQAGTGWIQQLAGRERSLVEMIDALGVVGSVGLIVAGVFILVRVTRQAIVAPIGQRQMSTARRQIVSALHRQAAERGGPERTTDR